MNKRIFHGRTTALLLVVPMACYGAPQGGQVVGGVATISQQGNTTTITQGSNRAAIDWSTFNVSRDELVQFLQPGSGSIALNRILDGNASVILGRVQSNGRLFLVNPRGIIFGNGARIDTAGLVASTLDVAPQQFMQSDRLEMQAAADSTGVIVNQGLIEASVGGTVMLLGRVIRHDGEIRAQRGRVQLVAADRAVIQFDSLGGFGIEVTQAVQQNVGGSTAQIDVGGRVFADGGYIVLDGKAASNLFDQAVNVSGIVEAKSLQVANGVIELRGDDGAVAVSGSVSTAGEQDGGTIAVNARDIGVTGRLDASAQRGSGGTIAINALDQAVVGGAAILDASSTDAKGGRIDIKAKQRTGILDSATLNARGAQGGVVHVGGDYQGSGSVTSQRTVVGADTHIDVSATAQGDGGEVVVWSDDYTYFAGDIDARGGSVGGNGGFVEVSGKQSLAFFGMVDTSAIYGEFGELLLDPAVINIINGSGGAQDAGVGDGVILSGDAPSPYVISEQALEALASNVTLTATQQINIANLADDELLFNPNGGTVRFNVHATSGTASFTMADVNDTIRVNNGNLVIDGTGVDSNINFTLGKLATMTSGNVTLNANATCTSTPFISACDGGTVSMSSGSIRSAGNVTIDGDSTGVGVTTFFFPFFIQGNGGAVTLNLGDIAASGAVSIDAVSSATGSPAGSSSASISVGDILVSNSSAIQISADSAQNASLENVYIGGNYLTGGGNITINGNTLNLTANTIIDSSIFGAGGTVSIPSAGNRVLNGHTLSLGVDNIYVGDISGSAGAADLGFSQADIDLFSGSTLTLRALGNIAIGNATITGPTSALQLVADRDNTATGDLLIASGKTLDLSGRSLTASGRNATIDGSILNSGTGTEQITTTLAFNLGSGASLTTGSGNISLSAGAGLTMASNATISSGSGQVGLTAANNIALGSVSTGNATTSAVSVTSTAGAISNAGAATNISASAAGSRVNLSAASGINSSLSAANLSLTNATSGAVTLTNDRALQVTSFINTPVTASSITTTGIGSDLTIAGNVASGSNLSLISSGAVTINNGTTVNSNAGTLSINAAGNAAITGLTTTNNTASAVSIISGGAVSDNGNTSPDITATQANAVVTLQAANGIGAANALDLSISRLALTNTTAGAANVTNNRALQVNSFTNTPATAASITTTGVGSDLTIAGNVASGSNLALTSSGTVTVNDGTTLNSNAGTLSINATGNVAITGLTTTNNTASAVSVISGGAISDNGDTNADITATQPNAVVTLQAASGIGAANALDLSISRLALTNSTSGTANITNNRALQVNSFTNTPVTAASITTTGAGSNLTIAGNVASGSNLALTSGGALSVSDGFTVNSNAGTLSINSAGTAAITGLTTTNNTASAVSVISGGSITGNGDTNPDIAATQANAVVTLQAASGIGATDALDLSISRLALTNTTSGAANITNNRALQINSFTNTPVSASSITTTGIGSDLTVAGNVASGSDLSLTSSGALSVTDGFTVDSGVGTLSVNATGNAAITGLATTNNTASAVSVISGGAITDSGDTNADITATQANAVVTLQAVTGIGAANALDLSISRLALTNSTSGAANIANNRALQVNSFTNTPAAVSIVTTGVSSDLTIAGNVASGSNLALSSSGAVTINDGTTVNSNAGTLSVSATGNAAVTGLTTTNNTAGAVSVISGGAITDGGDANTDIAATAGGVVLSAVAGIGSSNALDTNTGVLAATNTISGNIVVSDLSALQLNDVSNSGGNIDVTSVGTLMVNSGRTVSTSGNSALTLTAGAGTIVMFGNVSTAAGVLTLSADQSIQQAAGSIVSSGSGAITLTADVDSDDVGEILQVDGAQISSTSGALTLSAAEDVTLAHVQTGNATSNAVQITSTNGALVDGSDSAVDILATTAGAIVTLQAAAGIGNADAIETAIARLSLHNGASGDVAIANSGTMTTTSFINDSGRIDLQSSGDISLSGVQSGASVDDAIRVTSTGGSIFDAADVQSDLVTSGGVVLDAATGIAASNNAIDTDVARIAFTNADGDVFIEDVDALDLASSSTSNGMLSVWADGQLTVLSGAQVNSALGSMHLQSSFDSLVVDGNLSAASGDLLLAAMNNVTQGNASNIVMTTGLVEVRADRLASGVGFFAQLDGASIDAGNGEILVTAGNGAALASLTAGATSADAVAVTVRNGAITDAGDTDIDIVSGGGVSLSATNGIGDGDALEISAAQLAATNTAGNIDIANTAAASIAISQLGAGSVRYAADGDTSVGSVSSLGGDVMLLTSSGNIAIDTISSGGGAVLVSSASDIALTQQITSGNGAVSLVADNDDDGTGGIAFAAAAGINAGSNTIALTASQDVVITGLATTSASTGAISIATQGNVVDGGDIARDLSALNGGVVINAASMGDGNALESRIGTLDITASGRAALENSGALRIARLVASDAVVSTNGDIAVGGTGIDVVGNLSLGGTGTIDLNNTTIAADNVNVTAAGDLRVHNSTVDGISTIFLTADSDLNGSGNLDFDAASGLLGHGPTQVQLAANRVALQSLQNIALLAVTGDDIRFDRSVTADALAVTGFATVGSNVQLSADSMQIDNVLLGDSASLVAEGALSVDSLTLGAVGENVVQAGTFTAASIGGTGAALNLETTTADIDVLDIGAAGLAITAEAQAQQSLITIDSVRAGAVTIAGTGSFARSVQINGDAMVDALTIWSMSTASLSNVDSRRQIDIASDTIDLAGDLSAQNAVTLRGATRLATDINIVSGRAGDNAGGVLISGTLDGNAHALTIDAGNNVMCSDDAAMTSLSSLTVTESIKTVLYTVEAQEVTINARQEIYLNGDITAQSIRLDADSNGDEVGAIFKFEDVLLNAASIVTSGSIFDTDVRANCDFPDCAPFVPSYADIARDRMVAEQEADARGSGISDAFFAGQLKVSYLDGDCVDEDESSTVRCRQKRSMYDFLGTFLINNQLPAQ